MMARDWPAKDIGPLVDLIADPRHKITSGNPPNAARSVPDNFKNERILARTDDGEVHIPHVIDGAQLVIETHNGFGESAAAMTRGLSYTAG
jgi:hypothetical protein